METTMKNCNKNESHRVITMTNGKGATVSIEVPHQEPIKVEAGGSIFEIDYSADLYMLRAVTDAMRMLGSREDLICAALLKVESEISKALMGSVYRKLQGMRKTKNL